MPSPRTRRDTVRLLNKSGTGYVSDPRLAMRDGRAPEPEAVPRSYQEQLSLAAHRAQQQQRQLHRADLAAAPLDQRLRRCIAQAKAMRVDAHGELRLIRLALQGGRSHEHVARRLATLEARLWPDLEDVA